MRLLQDEDAPVGVTGDALPVGLTALSGQLIGYPAHVVPDRDSPVAFIGGKAPRPVGRDRDDGRLPVADREELRSA
jgi:hypothetical protein